MTYGEGLLSDISLSGARIEETSHRGKPGAKIEVWIAPHGMPPLHTWGRIVRETETGFALRFLEVDDLLVEWLADVFASQAATTGQNSP